MSTPVRIKSISKGPLGGSSDFYEKRLTIVHPFFGEEERFKILYKNWMSFSDLMKNTIDIIIVDDHGTPSIESLLTPSLTKRCNLNLSVFRIDKDLKYNTPGALNLGISMALTPWVLIMDSDCLFPKDMMDKVMQLKTIPSWQYKFDRKRITEDKHWAKNKRYLPCTILFHKDTFTAVNGFDEDYTGARSGGYAFFDTDFDRKILEVGYHCGRVPSEIYATEYMDDYIGPKVQRTRVDEDINRKLMYEKAKGVVLRNTQILQFPWRRVFNARRNS